MSQKMHSRCLLAFLLLITQLALAQVSKLDVYVAFRETTEDSSQEGTNDDPFSRLDTALNKILSLISSETQVNVHIAPVAQPYDLHDLEAEWLFGDILGITMKTWIDSPFCENCESVATLNLTNYHLMIDIVDFFNFESINIIGESGSIVSKSQNMMMQNVNIIASSTMNISFFKLYGVENVTFINVNLTMTEWGPFFEFANDFTEQYANLTFENVVIKLNDENIPSLNKPTPPLFLIDGVSHKMHRGKVSITNLKLEFDSSETLILPLKPLLKIRNFASANLHNLSLINRRLSLIPSQSFLDFENIKLLKLANIKLSQNQITVPSSSNLISLREVQNITVNSLELDSNYFQTLKTDTLHFHLNLFDITDANLLKILNHSLCSNTFDGFIRIFKIRGSEDSPDMDLEINGLLMADNENKKLSSNLFTYLSLQGLTLSGLNVSNITYRANYLSGRILSLQTYLNSKNHILDSILPPTKLLFSQISILDNRYSKDLNFLYFASNGDALSSEECLQILEPYTLQIHNLSVLNNSFAKESNNLWFYEVSLFDIRQTQVSFDNLTLIDASFEYYNFINLDQKPSTIVIKASTFSSVILQSSQLITTNYLNKFCYNPLPGRSIDSSTPLYRYSFIYESIFSGILLDNSGLLELDNGFLIFHKNTFYNISLVESSLVKTEFSPLRILQRREASESISNIEESAFSNLPEAWKLYSQILSLEKAASPRLKYFYWVSNNTFNRIDMANDLLNFIVINGLGSHESLIKFTYNSFQKISFDLDDTLNAIVDIDEIDTLEIIGNEFNNLQEKLKIFLLSKSNVGSSLMVSSNNLKSVNVHSFVYLKGKLISAVNISHNHFTRSEFTYTLISLNVEKSYDDWIFDSNRLISVTFLFDVQRIEGERFGLLQFLNGISKASSHVRLTNNTFRDLNFTKDEIYESPIQLCLLVLQTKQTVNLTNNFIRGIRNYNSGNLIYMLNLPSFIIKDCTFALIEYTSFTGMISLSSENIYVSNSTFDRISNDESFGVFHLKTVLDAHTIQIKNSTFIDLNIQNRAGVLAVRSSDYSSEAKTDFFKSLLPKLNLEISDCNIINLFGAHSIHLAEIDCSECTLNRNFFNISNQLQQTPLEVVEGVMGTLRILSPKLELKTVGNYSFLTLSNFRGQVFINDFNFNAGDVCFYLIDMDTGNLTLANSSFQKVASALVRMPFIGIRPTSQTSTSLLQKYYPKILLQNVTFAGFSHWSVLRSSLTRMGLFFLNVETVSNHGPQVLTLLNYQYNSTSRFQTVNILFSALPIQLTVQNCSFTDSYMVGGIMIASSSDQFGYDQLKIPPSKILVNNSRFANLQFAFGPGLAVLPYSYYPSVEVLNSTFEGNSAYTGGAIAVCNTSLSLSNSTLQRNKASLVGAAVFLGGTAISQMQSQDSLFKSNSAKHQGNIGTEAVDFKLSLIYQDSVSKKIDSDHSLEISNVELQNAILKLEYIDANGQLAPIFTDSTTPVSTSFSIPQNHQKNIQDKFTSSFQSSDATSGTISLSNIILGGFARENVSLIFKHCSERVNKEVMINITFRSCQAGEYNNTKTHQCQSCVQPTFTVDPSQPCTNCPDNADCPGQSQIVPKANYWSTGPQSSAIIKCRDESFNRCENKNGKQSCLEGYAGPICEACDFKNSFVETGYLKCGQCKDPQQSLKYSVIFGICYFFYQIFSVNAVYSANKFTSTNQNNYLVKRRVERSFYIKSLLTYTQIMSVLYIGNSHITKSFGLSAQFGNPSSLILYGTQCSLTALGVHYEDFLYVQTYSVILSPIIQLLGITLFMLMIRWVFNFMSASRVIATAAVYFLISYQPGIATSLTQFLSCTGQHIVGYDYVESHPAWTCTSEKYLFAANYIAKPALTLICFILPMVILSTLISKRKQIHTEELSASLGMLFFDLNPSHYYWGIILMVLKLALSFLVYGLNQDSKMQVYVSLILLWGYQSMVRIIEPYKAKAYNKFELIVINLLMFNIVVSTYMLGDEKSSWVTKASIGLSLILNGGFIILTAFKIISLTILDLISSFEKKVMNRRVTRSPLLLDESTNMVL